MLLIAFFGLALLTVPLLRGRLDRVADAPIRHRWAAFAGLAVQVLFITVLPGRLDALQRPVHMATYALATLFLVANRAIPGVWLIAAGAAANFAAIAANAGIMPATPDALRAAGMTFDKGDAFANSAALEHPRLAFLGDVFAVPASWPLSNVFSVGDVLIAVGVLVALHALSGTRLPGSGAAIGHVARHPGFMRVWLAQATSNVGDFVYVLAMTIVVVEQGGSAWTLAAVLVVQAGTAAVTGLFGGALADRLSRRRLMIIADLVRAGAVALLLLPAQPALWQILATAVVLGGFGAVFQPALQASIPNLVPPSALVSANALTTMTFNAAVLVGPVLGGLLAAGAGARVAFGLNAATFLLSAALIARTVIPRAPASERGDRVLAELAAGVRYVARARAARAVVAVTAGAMFAASLRQPVEPMLILHDLGGTAADLGLAATAWGLGMVLGSLAAPPVLARHSRGSVMAGSLLTMAAAIAGASVAGALGALLPLWLLAGSGNAVFVVTYETSLQEQTPDAFRGRVVAVNEAGLDLMLVAGILGGGTVAALAGTRGTLLIAAVVLLLTACAAARLLRSAMPAGELLSVEGVHDADRVLVRISSARTRVDCPLDGLSLRLGTSGALRSPVPDPASRSDASVWRASYELTLEEFRRWGAELALVGDGFETGLPTPRQPGLSPA